MATLYNGFLGGSSGALDLNTIQSSGQTGAIKFYRIPFTIAGAICTNGDVLRVASIKSNARIKSFVADFAAFGTSASVDIGFFQANGPGHNGAVVEVDTFADAYDVSGAVTADIFTGGVGGAGAVTLIARDRGKYLWEMVNLAEDPGEFWDIGITLNNKGNSASLTGVLQIEVVDAE